MTRQYADPVEVRRRDDAPAEFLWHGRLYLVRTVLAHWIEAGGWWQRNRLGSGPQVEAGGLDDREREFWRVEARTGGRATPNAATGVYDLCFDWSGGGWSLARTHD